MLVLIKKNRAPKTLKGPFWWVQLRDSSEPPNKMASSQGLTQRKKTFADDPFDDEKPSANGRTSPDKDRKDRRARDPNEVFDSDDEKDKTDKLTLMEEIVLLGMKDDQVRY